MGRRSRRSRERSSSTRHRSQSRSRSKDRHSIRSHRHKGDHHYSRHCKKGSRHKAHKDHHRGHHHGDSESSRRRTVEISIGKEDLQKVLGSEAELLLANKAEEDVTSDSDASSTDNNGVDRTNHERGGVKMEPECGTEKYSKLLTQLKTGSPLRAFEGSSGVKGPMRIVLKGQKDEGKAENTVERAISPPRSRSHSHSHSPPCNQKHPSGQHSSDECSHSKQRKHSQSRSREGSCDQSWEHLKTRSRDRSKDRSRDRSRRSRDRSRDRLKRRSRGRSRDRSRDRLRDRSRSRSRRSRDRSRESHTSRYHHSPQRRSSSSDREHSDRSKSNQQKKSQAKTHPVLSKKAAEINEYTSICQQISASHYVSVLSMAQQCETEIADSGVGDGMVAEMHPYRDPFAVKEAGSTATSNLVFHDSVWKTPTQAVLDGADPSSVGIEAEKEFPVSDGIQHRAVEAVDEQEEMGSLSIQVSNEVNVSELVMIRMCLTEQLNLNPDDYEAQQQLQAVELKIKQWSNSSLKMGQYTGNVTLTPIAAKEKNNTGLQAWVKRDMFQNLKPVGDGFGAEMLRRLGWKEGEPLGKSGIGRVEPVADEVKLDRKCLAADDEVAKLKKAKPQTFYPDSSEPDVSSQPSSTPAGGPVCSTGCYVGKHPVSALNELCTRKRWTIQYELVMSSGPPHSRNFKYQVTLPVGSFQPDKMCGNKKLAKAEAAMACLKAVGLA